MTGTDLCVNKPHMSRSHLNHLVYHFDKRRFPKGQSNMGTKLNLREQLRIVRRNNMAALRSGYVE